MRVQYTFRTRLLAMTCVALAVVTTPALLFAHAKLVRSSPAAKATLDAPPTSLSLWFSEQPELRFTSLQLLDSAGAAVALGPLTAIAGDPMGIRAPVSQPLPNGRYSVAWRTAAADGHASNGRFSFVVAVAQVMAQPSPAAPPPVASPRPNTIVHSAENVTVSTPLRWAELVAVLTLIGVVIFRLVVVKGADLPAPIVADAADRARRLAQSALVLFVVATFTRLVAESDLVPNAANSRISAVMMVVRETRWGHAWMLGLTGAVLVLVGLFAARASMAGWFVAALGVVAIALSEGLTGHAGASTRYLPLAIAADVAHFLGAGGWLGGLTALLLSGFPALRPLDDAERRLAGSRLVRSFHRAAIECVLLVVITGLVAAWMRLGALNALWTTPYGSMLFRKLIFVLGLLAFGWYHQRTAVRPEWDGDTKFRFQRSAIAELIVGAVVVAFTALLIGTALPTQ